MATTAKKWVPRNYQKKGVLWLLRHPVAALLVDLGLGKTSIVLKALATLLKAGTSGPALVVAPLRVAQLVWSHAGEVGEWEDFRHLRVSLIHGTPDEREEAVEQQADLYVVNYDGLSWLAANDRLRKLIRRGVDTLVFDELSKMKHTKTKRFKLLKPYLGLFRRRWGLTGSPTSNGLIDLFGQVYSLDLGARLGKYITHFRRRWFYQTGYGGYTYVPLPNARREITEAVRDIALAIRAEDHLDLPVLVEQNLWFDLPAAARETYDDLEEKLLVQLDDGIIKATNAAVVTTKLRQVASGGCYVTPSVLGPALTSRTVAAIHDEKTNVVEEVVDELQGQPLLITYEYQHDLVRLKARFSDLRTLGSGLSEKQATQVVRAWNSGELRILAGHPASMGHGLNLQHAGCSHLVMYSPTFDYDLYVQMIGRLRRQGATARRIVVLRILARDTIDEEIVKSLATKRRGQDAVFAALVARRDVRRHRG